MKLCFATGVLTIPSAFSVVGYGPGVILLVCWGALTTCKDLTNNEQERISLTNHVQTTHTSCTHFA